MSYTVQDILMYSREVYLYYLDAYGETYSVIRWGNLILGSGFLILLVAPSRWLWQTLSNHRNRIASFVLAYVWAWVGLSFHLMTFAQINYIAYGLGGIFLLESGLLLLIGTILNRLEFGCSRVETDARTSTVSFWIGISTYLFTLTVIPLLTLYEINQIHFFGWTAEATAAGTMGCLLLGRKGGTSYVLFFLPFLYVVYAFLRARVFEFGEQFWLLPVALITASTLYWKET